jgi:hypothetical protein
LYAIIGLKSIPAMQYGQRMVKTVSVGIGCPAPETKEREHAEFQTSIWKSTGNRIAGQPPWILSQARAEISAGVPTGGH